jgi:electron transfer flavoprotein beta subunit
MNIVVLMKQVPDLVEGLEIDASGKALDVASLRYILSESDDHALEQALLIKEKVGGLVEVLALDQGEARESLLTAMAKGADRAALVDAGLDSPPDNHAAAQIFTTLLRAGQFDLILTGVRAIDDLDGSLGGLVAGSFDLPYAALIRKAEADGDGKTVIVEKEYPGGYAAELEVRLPAVLGIQAAEQPPRYVPISRLRQVMKTATVEEVSVSPPSQQPLGVERLFKPEEGAGAVMISGDAKEAARQIAGLFSERRLLR